MIRYTQAFRTAVQGTLSARFVMDTNGPRSSVQDGTRFYFIRLRLDSPLASQITKVTYLLDEATYWEPERETTDAHNGFEEEITSYGDFLVRVEVQTHSGRIVQNALLSDMLEVGHANDMTTAIQAAIDYIREN